MTETPPFAPAPGVCPKCGGLRRWAFGDYKACVCPEGVAARKPGPAIQLGFPQKEIGRGATFSPCRTWRYELWNCWDPKAPILGYVGCNPSDADELKWDLTARKFDGFARRLGFGRWYAANLFALVSTDPSGLHRFKGDPIGPDNDDWLRKIAERCDKIVMCWGATGGVYEDRVEHVVGMLEHFPLFCFGKTRTGHPRHPSRIAYKTPLVPFSSPTEAS